MIRIRQCNMALFHSTLSGLERNMTLPDSLNVSRTFFPVNLDYAWRYSAKHTQWIIRA